MSFCVTWLGSPIGRSRCSQLKSNGTYYPLVNINLKTLSPGIPILPLSLPQFTNKPVPSLTGQAHIGLVIFVRFSRFKIIINGPSLFDLMKIDDRQSHTLKQTNRGEKTEDLGFSRLTLRFLLA